MAGHFTVVDDFSLILGYRLLGLYLNLKGTEPFFLEILLLKMISVRYLVIDCWALGFGGTDTVDYM